MPILDGLVFTFLIIKLDFLDNKVKTIKNDADEISPGILKLKGLISFQTT